MRYFLLVILAITISLSANNKPGTKLGTITGLVLDPSNSALYGANIILEGQNIGAATNENGEFALKNIPEGKYRIVVSMIGFKAFTDEIEVKANTTVDLDVSLDLGFYETGTVVVTGTVNPYLYEESPVKTELVSKKVMQQSRAINLAEALQFQPGVRVENNCQNCNFTQIRLLGFEGKYSQILVDGDPVVSSLAGVYALEQFPEEMIGQIEIVKGGGSALYGSGAIAGSVNLITAQPSMNRYRADYQNTITEGIADNKLGVVAEMVNDEGTSGIFLFGSVRNRNPYDKNGDGYSELGKLSNESVGLNWFYKPSGNNKLKVSVQRIHEERRGGNDFDLEVHEADVAEAVEHQRWGGKVKWEHFLSTKLNYNIYSSVSLLHRDSYYGGLGDADEDGVITDFDRVEALNFYGNSENETYISGARVNYTYGLNKFTAGVEYSSDHLKDDSVKDEKYHINQTYTNFGVYLQDDLMFGYHLNLIAGLRMDKHSELEDMVLSPRLNIKYEIIEGLDFRAGFSTGFKAPQTFDEDLHIESLGGDQRVVRNIDGLKEEKSYSFSGGFEFQQNIGEVPVLFGATGFYTRLEDAYSEVEAGTTSDNLVLWHRVNSDGAKLYGVELDFGVRPSQQLEVRAGVTIKENSYDSEQEIFDGEFSDKFQRTPDLSGIVRVMYDPLETLSLIGAVKYTGTMEVPNEATGKIVETDKHFFDADLGAAIKLPFITSFKASLSIGVKNLFDSYQEDLQSGADRDPAYLYGPQLPRRFYVGFDTEL